MKYFATSLLMALLASFSWAETITLKVPVTKETPESAAYYHELLTASLEAMGHTVNLEIVTLPQGRVRSFLDDGDIDLAWMVESAERNEKYTPVEIGISDSLIGKRILLIRPEDQALFDKVNSLEDFRALQLTGGMGKGWFDSKVWRGNELQFREQEGNWRTIYKMLAAKRTYDYFPRGMNEIVGEAAQQTDLAIEKNLVLKYERDFRFYLSTSGKGHKEILQEALENAKTTGLMDKLVKKHWAGDFEALDMENRRVLDLTTPN